MNLFTDDIQPELQQVETTLLSSVKSRQPILEQSAVHLLQAGGKRLRPALVLIAAKFGPADLQQVQPLAVSLELIHMATLVHDDVIDASVTRRGMPTVKAKWGNRISIHTGDYLFARALELLEGYTDPQIPFTVAKISVMMCEGEIQQIISCFDPDQSIKDYFFRIKRKTALLISACCQLGALAGGAENNVVRVMARYGYYTGMAFQITDDILDFIADPEELGKPVGSDLREGIVTLPSILALKSSTHQDELYSLLKKTVKNDDEIQRIINLVIAAGGVNQAMEIANKYIAKAKNEIEKLPDLPTKLKLEMIADFINIRRH